MELVVVGQDLSKIKTAAGMPAIYDVLLQQHLMRDTNGRFWNQISTCCLSLPGG